MRDIAQFFGDEELIRRTEEVIADELADVSEDLERYRSLLSGKTAALYAGGSRSHHYQMLLADLGVSTVLAGHEFAHRDDYEGRDVIPFIKEDADNKNIETIHMERDPEFYREFLDESDVERLSGRIALEEYEGLM
jgi:nitrogenase molybdenum-iron protein alpha chain